MALSDYSVKAFDKDGKRNNGDLKLSDSAIASIYKTWVYLSDTKAWHDGCSFIEPTIAQIDEGRVAFCSSNIWVKKKRSKNAVFVLVRSYTGDVQGGVGCYDPCGEYGVPDKTFEKYLAWVKSLELGQDVNDWVEKIQNK